MVTVRSHKRSWGGGSSVCRRSSTELLLRCGGEHRHWCSVPAEVHVCVLVQTGSEVLWRLITRCARSCPGMTWEGRAAPCSPALQHSAAAGVGRVSHRWAELGHCLPLNSRKAGAFPALPRVCLLYQHECIVLACFSCREHEFLM